MNSSEVFALRQLLSRLEAPTKTIGREVLMTEAVTRHPSQDVEHLGEHKSRALPLAFQCMDDRRAKRTDSVFAPLVEWLSKSRFRGRVDGRYWRIGVAKLRKCRVTNFPRKDETSDNRQSMPPQTRCRNRL